MRRAVIVLLAVYLAACAHGTSRAVEQSIDDATISTHVKTALLNEPGVSFTRVDVETVHGVVTLSGAVKSKEEEQKVIAVTRGVKGVKDVKSALRLEPQTASRFRLPASSFPLRLSSA
jgi:osmotically-inducible protein OsmY